ncbi:MAG: hypothetical protein K6V73_12210 [Firmicutes bacterium]|nr:hypothetical protein [Bacillota bacterium]
MRGSRDRRLSLPAVEAFEAVPGQGVRARAGGSEVLVGRLDVLAPEGVDVAPLAARGRALEEGARPPCTWRATADRPAWWPWPTG